MSFEGLLGKYKALLAENVKLKDELKSLKEQCEISESRDDPEQDIDVSSSDSDYLEQDLAPQELSCKNEEQNFLPNVNNFSDPKDKIELFMTLFKGRDDVYAKRWESKKKGTSGYSPVCLNEWKAGLCKKPAERCSRCSNKAYASLDEKVIDSHLRGRGHFVAGIYPLLPDETCCFLAIDFDEGGWEKDVGALRDICREFTIPIAIERSRSGNGSHAWFFFKQPVTAAIARKFGTALLTHSMSKRHEIPFKSYDRLFPNQDTMPKGGLGNLIALPLQREARSANNSEFIDENYKPYDDQWAFLASLSRLSEEDITLFIMKLCNGNEYGVLRKDEEMPAKPWERRRILLSKNDFPQSLEIVQANMLFIPKAGFSEKALNQMKRLAAFKNPEFYKMQAMRMPTGQIPRIISCSEETAEYLCLPRGSKADLQALLTEYAIDVHYIDKTNCSKKINVEFTGQLRDDQPVALQRLLEYDNGVLSGTTAFGKTVVAIALIAARKVNTLILVDRVNLVAQWKKRLAEFLAVYETLPDTGENLLNKRGRKKAPGVIGQIGGGKNSLNGIIDIAVIQSLNRMGEVKECVKDYGLVIVDECHHISAFSFEKVLKSINAKYVYGLTATPTRKDGHHPIIFMQCGEIRYRDDARKQAEKRPFEHYVIPRFTPFRVPLGREERDVAIQELYAEITESKTRNELIVADVVRNHEQGRNCIVLTERTAHVELLAQELSKKIPDVFSLMGGMGAKKTRENMQAIEGMPLDKPLTLVSTGKYIGEGFDEPRLDTLFLAMPISWKGTLQQYAGRLHRLFDNKNEVRIYDYVDIHVRMLEKMYNKRLNGYAAIGYKAKGETSLTDSINIIFNKSNFLPVYTNDIVNATKELVIVSPFITRKRTSQMLEYLHTALQNKVNVTIVTRTVEDFRGKARDSFVETLNLFKGTGINLIFKAKIHQKFAIIDQKTVWYGSINLLSFGSAEESIMRLDSSNVANELIKSIDN
ncbi:MAG: DEAD/DEAH box helicase family protein [Phycisphaerales bacterium]